MPAASAGERSVVENLHDSSKKTNMKKLESLDFAPLHRTVPLKYPTNCSPEAGN